MESNGSIQFNLNFQSPRFQEPWTTDGVKKLPKGLFLWIGKLVTPADPLGTVGCRFTASGVRRVRTGNLVD